LEKGDIHKRKKHADQIIKLKNEDKWISIGSAGENLVKFINKVINSQEELLGAFESRIDLNSVHPLLKRAHADQISQWKRDIGSLFQIKEQVECLCDKKKVATLPPPFVIKKEIKFINF